ncbi:hypothetical protein MHY85_05140 [Cellulomonas sp. ACRRI]|uniref:phage tail tube protein n=1 Tax=Cellulomonas sp. ACRRI TaxID=2918188 RepID=UPI001EF26DD0|nr:hypothetical protein [Cellulomonas sp. ACRRI]MCG7285360.1 hypothetical protein [Cellulomonas sp. ACRRI]
MSNIPSTPADGNVKTVIATIANAAAPTVTELNAGTAVDISCYITAGGFVLGQDQAPIADDRECDTFTAEQPGRKSYSGSSITAIDNTNTVNEATYNDANDALTEGATVKIARRYGLPHTTDFVATTQKTDVIVAVVGAKRRVAVEANSTLRSMWPLYVQEYHQDVTVATGA